MSRLPYKLVVFNGVIKLATGRPATSYLKSWQKKHKLGNGTSVTVFPTITIEQELAQRDTLNTWISEGKQHIDKFGYVFYGVLPPEIMAAVKKDQMRKLSDEYCADNKINNYKRRQK